METIDGIRKYSIEDIWSEMDKIMLSLHPTHSRRINFLSMKPSKNETASHFIHSMKEQAVDAKINQLTEASLILHLMSAGLPQSELNKSAKRLIIEQLRENPNQKDLTEIVAKLKGIEADHKEKTDVKSVIPFEYNCRVCMKKHSKGQCKHTCKHCKKTGHRSDDCWQEYGRPGQQGGTPKRERSVSTEGRSEETERQPKRKKGSQKTNVKQVQPSEQTTDRDSTQSDTEFEETPPKEVKKHASRKIRGILKYKIQKTKQKKTTKSDQTDKDLTRSASASNLAALDESELCTTDSSEDEVEEINDFSEKILKAYKNRMKTHKIRRIKSQSGNSATMYGKIKTNSRQKRAKFVADSGTGIPIIPMELVRKYELAWGDVDPDEPGCERY